MAEQSNKPKITFKVKHLDEYHDIVINWNDDRYVDPFQQIFEQLESITGVPSRYTSSVYIQRPDEAQPGVIACGFINQKACAPGSQPNFRCDYRENDMLNQGIRDCFHLQYFVHYDNIHCKRISMKYGLVKERYVTEGACNRDFCQYQCTESHFKRLKDLVSNDELNTTITQLVQPLVEDFSDLNYLEVEKIFRDFNVKQYLCVPCAEQRRRRIERNGHERQYDLYKRTRG